MSSNAKNTLWKQIKALNPRASGYHKHTTATLTAELARMSQPGYVPEPAPVRQSGSTVRSAAWQEYKQVAGEYGTHPAISWQSKTLEIQEAVADIRNRGETRAFTCRFNVRLELWTREGIHDEMISESKSITTTFKHNGRSSDLKAIMNSLARFVEGAVFHISGSSGFKIGKLFVGDKEIATCDSDFGWSWDDESIRNKQSRAEVPLEHLVPANAYTVSSFFPSSTDFVKLPLMNANPADFYSLSSGIQMFDQKCVLNMLLTHLQDQRGFAKITLESLRAELGSNTPCLERIHEWLEEKDISHYLCDAMGQLVYKYSSESRNVQAIYAQARESHIYMITDKDTINLLTHGHDTTGRALRPQYKKDHTLFEFNMCREVLESRGGLGEWLDVDVLDRIASAREENEHTIVIVKSTMPNTMECLIDQIYRKHNILVENIIGDPDIKGFTYKELFVTWDNDSKALVSKIHDRNPFSTITWENQSLGTLANQLFAKHITTRSSMNQTTFDAFSICPVVPNACLVDSRDLKKKKAGTECYDINRAYRACFVYRDEPFYFISPCDQFDPVLSLNPENPEFGYYFLSSSKPISIGPFSLAQRCGDRYQVVVRTNVLRFLLKNRFIDASMVAGFLKPAVYIDQEIAKTVVSELDELVPFDSPPNKLVLNAYFGMLAKTDTEINTTELSTDTTMSASMLLTDRVDMVSHFEQNRDILKLRKSRTGIAIINNRPIYHDILVDCVVRMFYLYQKLYTPECTLISYKTDSITISGHNKIEVGDQPGQYKLDKKELAERSKSRISSKLYRATPVMPIDPGWNDISVYTPGSDIIDESYMQSLVLAKTSFRIQAQGGFGKSTLVSKLMKFIDQEASICLGLGFTNQVRIVLNKLGIPSKTIDMLFHKANAEMSEEAYWTNIINQVQGKYLVVDEIGMIPRAKMEQLYQLWHKTRIPVIFIGDFRQLGAVEIRKGVKPTGSRDNFTISCVKQMCNNNLIELKHAYRCDPDIQGAALKSHARERQQLAFNTGALLPRRYNICRTNEKRKEVNLMCLEHFNQGKPRDELGFYPGTPIRAKLNPSKIFYNGDSYTYVRYDPVANQVIVKDSEDNVERFITLTEGSTSAYDKIFRLGYCSTVHSYQGMTIDEHFNLYEVSSYSNRMAYTAFTRGTRAEYLHVDSWPVSGIFWEEKSGYEMEDITAKMTSHWIYVLEDTRDTKRSAFYVGQTDNLERRRAEHLENAGNPECTLPVYEYIRNNLKRPSGEYAFRLTPILNCSGDDVDHNEYLAIQALRSRGFVLKNDRLMPEITPAVNPRKSVNPVMQLNLKGSIKDRAGKKEYMFTHIINGVPKSKCFAYRKCPQEEALAKAHEFQRQYSLTGSWE